MSAAVESIGDAGQPLNFATDPVAHLQAVLQHVPSLDALPHLTSPLAKALKDQAVAQQGTNNMATIAALYYQAAARHLPVQADAQHAVQVAAAAAGDAAPLPAAVVAEGNDAAMHQTIAEILETLAHLAPQCEPRTVIAESGILPLLIQRIWPTKGSGSTSSSLISMGASLTTMQPDILQILLYAGQAQEAQLLVTDTWPRPTSRGNALLVLRYYYLRGLVHLQCQNYEWAWRCFQTCLTVPADAVSVFCVASWKKMVLLACLAQSRQSQVNLVKTPKTMPTCVQRFLNQALQQQQQSREGRSNASATTGPSEIVFAEPEDVTSPLVGGGGMVVGSTAAPLLHKPELAFADGAMIMTVATAAADAPAPEHYGIGAYATLSRAFGKVDRAAFATTLQQNSNLFCNKDGNQLLVQLVEQEMARRQVYHWSRVFSTITLQHLGQRLSMSEQDLSALLASMSSSSGSNTASWNVTMQGDMVHLPKLEPTVSGSNASMMEDLAQLTQMIQKLDASLSTSPKFLSLVRKESPAVEAAGKAGRVEDM